MQRGGGREARGPVAARALQQGRTYVSVDAKPSDDGGVAGVAVVVALLPHVNPCGISPGEIPACAMHIAAVPSVYMCHDACMCVLLCEGNLLQAGDGFRSVPCHRRIMDCSGVECVWDEGGANKVWFFW